MIGQPGSRHNWEAPPADPCAERYASSISSYRCLCVEYPLVMYLSVTCGLLMDISAAAARSPFSHYGGAIPAIGNPPSDEDVYLCVCVWCCESVSLRPAYMFTFSSGRAVAFLCSGRSVSVLSVRSARPGRRYASLSLLVCVVYTS